MPAQVISNRYMAITAAGAVDHFTKIAENDMATIAIKRRIGIAGLFVECNGLALLGVVNAENSISQKIELANLIEILLKNSAFLRCYPL
jgi:hypothetical protein